MNTKWIRQQVCQTSFECQFLDSACKLPVVCQSASNSKSQLVKLLHIPLNQSAVQFLIKQCFWRENANQHREIMLSIQSEHWSWLKNNNSITIYWWLVQDCIIKMDSLRALLIHSANQPWQNTPHDWIQVISTELGLFKTFVYLVHPRATLQNITCNCSRADWWNSSHFVSACIWPEKQED